jgi:hypothetical protein
MLELLQKGQRCTGGALLTSCMLLLLLYDDLYWSMFSLQLLLATREGSHAVVGRLQEVGEEGGLEDDTADVRPHCWHCRKRVKSLLG